MNKNHPLVSIALCTYNGERFLEEQLQSLLRQSYTNIEIIVVDDCSTDGTMVILERYARRYTNLKVYRNNRNLGFTKNFEKALLLCSGELIAISDQDDVWHCDKIMSQVESIGENLLIYHNSEFITESGNKLNRKMSDKFNFYRGSNPEPFLLFNCVSGHSILLKKDLLCHALPFPEGLWYDQWLAYTAATKGSIDFMDVCLVNYRIHSESSLDILNIKVKKKQSAVDSFERQLLWLNHCSNFEDKDGRRLANRLKTAYQKRADSFISFSYAYLILKHRNLLLYLQKKGSMSKFNYIIKQVWGLKAKNLL